MFAYPFISNNFDFLSCMRMANWAYNWFHFRACHDNSSNKFTTTQRPPENDTIRSEINLHKTAFRLAAKQVENPKLKLRHKSKTKSQSETFNG